MQARHSQSKLPAAVRQAALTVGSSHWIADCRGRYQQQSPAHAALLWVLLRFGCRHYYSQVGRLLSQQSRTDIVFVMCVLMCVCSCTLHFQEADGYN